MLKYLFTMSASIEYSDEIKEGWLQFAVTVVVPRYVLISSITVSPLKNSVFYVSWKQETYSTLNAGQKPKGPLKETFLL